MRQAIPDPSVFESLAAFAATLGWQRLIQHSHTFKDRSAGEQFGRTVFRWQARGSRGLFFHACCAPIGQFRVFNVAVYALAFRMHSGFHRVRVDGRGVAPPIAALTPHLAYQAFATAAGRLAYRQAFPDRCSATWRRLRTASALGVRGVSKSA